MNADPKTVPIQEIACCEALQVESELDSAASYKVLIPRDFHDLEISWVTDEKEIGKVGII